MKLASHDPIGQVNNLVQGEVKGGRSAFGCGRDWWASFALWVRITVRMTWHGRLTVSSAVTTVITFPRFFFFCLFCFHGL